MGRYDFNQIFESSFFHTFHFFMCFVRGISTAVTMILVNSPRNCYIGERLSQILENVPLVLFENSFFQTEKIKKWFDSEKIKPNIIMQSKQLSTMLSMISKNVAVGFVFKEITRTNKDFVPLPCKTPMYADMSLVWNKNSYNFNSMEKFKNYIKENNSIIV